MDYLRILDIDPKDYRNIQKICKGLAEGQRFPQISAYITNDAMIMVEYSHWKNETPKADVCLSIDGMNITHKTIELTNPMFDFTLEYEGNSYSLILQKEKPRLESV